MTRCVLHVFLLLGLTGCPTAVESPTGSNAGPAPTPTAAQPAGAPPQAGMPGPPPNVPKGGDQLQREIGALSKKGQAIKDSVTRHIEKNAAAGLLSVDNGFGGTDNVSFVRFHDPVRAMKDRGYVVLTDFVAPNAEPGAFYTVAFWLKDMPTGYRVTEVKTQSHPEKRDGTWVRMEHFQVNDDVATPVK